jgi:hypothetical protein
MTKHWPVALGLFAAASPAVAQEPAARGFGVVEAGMYTRKVVSSQRDSNGVVQNVISDPQLVSGTTRIPARIGVSFGFRFIVSGPPGSKVTLRKETLYPAPGARPPGSASPLARSSASLDLTMNRVRFTGYTLAEPWELMPGKWVISIWQGNRKLGEQQFTVVKE